MKINEKPNPKKGKVKKKDGVSKQKPKKEKVLVVAQEIKYARLLCSNEKKTRDRVLKALKKWLSACFEKNYEFKEEDFLRVWKGLFYAVWMSDKPLIQEELCENISSIMDTFPPEQLTAALLMMKAGFKTLAMEWYGIDHHRMDKFLMLVRRYLRGGLRVLHRCSWSTTSCELFARALGDGDGVLAAATPRYARNALSMLLHLTDCYLEEIAKVSGGNISGGALNALLRPVVVSMCLSRSPPLVVGARRVLTALLRQSETELKMRDKIRAWEKMGCPEGGPDALETDDEDDEQENHDDENHTDDHDDDSGSAPLDPRAGRVDVSLPLLAVPAAQLARALRDMLPLVEGKAYRRVTIVAQRFERLAKGQPAFPPPEAPPSAGGTKRKGTIRKMMQFEQKIVEDADELRLRGLSRKHRKRLLKKTRAGLSIVEDVEQMHTQTDKRSNGEWKIETLDENPDKEIEVKNTTKTDKTTRKRKTEQDSSPVVAKKQKNDIKTNKKQKINKKDKNKLKDKASTELKGKLNSEKETINTKENKSKTEINKKHDTKEELQNGVTKKKKHSNISLKENKTNKKQVNKTKTQTKIDSQNGFTENKTETKTDSSKTLQNGHTENKTKTKTDSAKSLQNDITENKTETKTQQNDVTENKTKTVSSKIQKDNRVFKSYTFDINNVNKNPKNANSKSPKTVKPVYDTPKKVKFVLKNNSMQKPVDYYKSVRQSPNIPFDSSKKPIKTNLKPCTPSPINPFFKKKLKMKK